MEAEGKQAPERYAVVTGANKGIGLAVVRQLAASGVTVVLTARNEKRGTEAVSLLHKDGLSNVVFHQLDVTDKQGIECLAKDLKTQYERLDILFLPNEERRKLLDDIESLTEEKIDEILEEFLRDLKADTVEANGWFLALPPYSISKATLNAYNRLVAKKHPKCASTACILGLWIRTLTTIQEP